MWDILHITLSIKKKKKTISTYNLIKIYARVYDCDLFHSRICGRYVCNTIAMAKEIQNDGMVNKIIN